MSSLPGFIVRADTSPLFRRRSAAEVVPVTTEQALAALQKDAVGRRILAKGIVLQNGARAGSRLNINLLRSTGVAVNTVHRGRSGDGYTQGRGWWSGEVLTYQPVVVLRNAYLNVSQTAREKIASGGGAKEPMASCDGEYVACTVACFDGVELRFNPAREHLFRDALGRAVRRAEEVTVSGNSVFARGEIEYYGHEDAPARAGSAPSAALIYQPEPSASVVQTTVLSQVPLRSSSERATP